MQLINDINIRPEDLLQHLKQWVVLTDVSTDVVLPCSLESVRSDIADECIELLHAIVKAGALPGQGSSYYKVDFDSDVIESAWNLLQLNNLVRSDGSGGCGWKLTNVG
eukprot:9633369-Karenia_brevis.AAC.1